MIWPLVAPEVGIVMAMVAELELVKVLTMYDTEHVPAFVVTVTAWLAVTKLVPVIMPVKAATPAVAPSM